MYHYSNPYQMPIYQPQHVRQFPQYPQSEKLADQLVKQPLYPDLKLQTLNIIEPFVKYGLKEAQATSYEHSLKEVAAMTYLIGKGMDPYTAYLTVESWETDEMF